MESFEEFMKEHARKQGAEMRNDLYDLLGIVHKGIHSCFKCTSEPYQQGHVEAECEICQGKFWLDEEGLPFNPDKEVRHGEILRSLEKVHSD